MELEHVVMWANTCRIMLWSQHLCSNQIQLGMCEGPIGGPINKNYNLVFFFFHTLDLGAPTTGLNHFNTSHFDTSLTTKYKTCIYIHIHMGASIVKWTKIVLWYTKTIFFFKGLKVVAKCCLNWISFHDDLYYCVK